jgi:alkaline phosphatase D
MSTELPVLERAVAVGRVSPRGVRLWMRSPGGGAHRLELWLDAVRSERVTYAFDMGDRAHSDHTHAFAYPDDIPGARPLEPVTRYGYRISRADGVLVGEGCFETLPARSSQMPRRFCIGVASCHQPFDDTGEMHEMGLRMLRVARVAWERCDVKQVLWVGDQLYADYPESQSAMGDLDGKWARIHLLGGSMARVLEQPVGGLNVGAIEVELDGDLARLNFKLFGEDEHTPGEPKLLFESGFQ